jgi:hypothetical protein
MKRRPRLLVELQLENHGRIWLDAESYEDEVRLRRWLRASAAFERLVADLAKLLDDLDRDGQGDEPGEAA